MTIRTRIAIGLVLYSIGSAVVVTIHAVPLAYDKQSTVSNTQIICLIIPMVFFALAEVLTIVSGLSLL